MASAREGERTEDLSQRTESVSVYANPNGTFTSRDFGGAVRVKQLGDWQPIDYTFVEQADGSYAPKASNLDITINGGSAKEAAWHLLLSSRGSPRVAEVAAEVGTFSVGIISIVNNSSAPRSVRLQVQGWREATDDDVLAAAAACWGKQHKTTTDATGSKKYIVFDGWTQCGEPETISKTIELCRWNSKEAKWMKVDVVRSFGTVGF